MFTLFMLALIILLVASASICLMVSGKVVGIIFGAILMLALIGVAAIVLL